MSKKTLILIVFLAFSGSVKAVAFSGVRISAPLTCRDHVAVLSVSSFVPRISPVTHEVTGPEADHPGLLFVYRGYQTEWGVSEITIAQARLQDANFAMEHYVDLEYRDPSGTLRGFMRLVSTTPFSSAVARSGVQRLPFFLWYGEEKAIGKHESRYPRAVEVIRTYTDPEVGSVGRFRIMMLLFRAALGTLHYFGKLDHMLVSASMEHNHGMYETIGFKTDSQLVLEQHKRWFQYRAVAELLKIYFTDVNTALFSPDSFERYTQRPGGAIANPPLEVALSGIARRVHPQITFWSQPVDRVTELEAIAGNVGDLALLRFRRMHALVENHFDIQIGQGDAAQAIKALESDSSLRDFSAELLDPDSHHELRLYTIGLIHVLAGDIYRASSVKQQIERIENSGGSHLVPLNTIGRIRVDELAQQFGEISSRSSEELLAEIVAIDQLKPIYPYWLTAPIHERRTRLYRALGSHGEAEAAQKIYQELIR